MASKPTVARKPRQESDRPEVRYDSIILAVSRARAATWLLDVAADEDQSVMRAGLTEITSRMPAEELGGWLRTIAAAALLDALAEIEVHREADLRDAAKVVA